MIARFSKYDFWIPGKISDRYRWKYFFNTFFFEMKKILEKVEKIILGFLVLIRAKVGNFRKNSQNNFLNFFRDFFHFKNNVLKKYFHLYRSEICSGIQKTHLENRAINLKSRNKKSAVFLASFSTFCMILRVSYVHRPLSAKKYRIFRAFGAV